MRISEETRFPHPVLSPDTGDFPSGEFDLSFVYQENPETGALTLEHNITLTEAGIKELVETGKAAVGCFVRCGDTYYTELRTLAFPSGRSDFAAGTLLNRVSLRPVIWLKDNLPEWNYKDIHEEFSPPISLSHGDIIAFCDEHIISVGQAKLASIESIFELDHSPDVPEGVLQVQLDCDRITILTSQNTHEAILLLRGQARGKPVVMNAVYLPAVMEVLDALRDGAGQYDVHRWYAPFIARCDHRGIDPSAEASILENAQKLLDSPTKSLASLTTENE